jgi:hypothetical protein
MNVRPVGTSAQRRSRARAFWRPLLAIVVGILLALMCSSRATFAARAIVTDQGP